MTDLGDTRWCPVCGAHDSQTCLTPSGRDHADRPKRTKAATEEPPKHLDLQSIRAAARGLIYVSDGTRGSDKVAHLLASISPLLESLDEEQTKTEQLNQRIAAALREQDESTYGDAELPFRMRAHLDPNRTAGAFGASDRQGRQM
jgi:hypothetical protein